MANDIIAESQTQRTIDTLMRGEADSKSQQVALASLLIAVTKQNEELASIRESLWSKDDVEKYVDARHSAHCRNCPAKKYVESVTAPDTQRKKERPWYLELLTSESVRYFILVLILVWTVVVMRTTSEETAAVMDNVRHTLSGGHK